MAASSARAPSLDQTPPLRLQRKIALLGARATGKTSLATRFVQRRFADGPYAPTIENSFAATVRFCRAHVSAELIDCSGADDHARLSRNASVGVHGYVLAYSIASRASFDRVRRVNDAVLRVQGGSPGVARVLVATMADLRSQRQVTRDEGAELAARWRVPFVECSAKENLRVADVFTVLLKEIERDSGFLDPEPVRGCALL
mmetsp:Transcript_30556/g.91789  ORF Transcript_30556/g.91789 Transcript_30556/m.91789 type:complete len:202 (-) Transcript_30556:58-663(-)